MIEITESEELTEPEEIDFERSEQSDQSTINKSNQLKFRLTTVSKPHRTIVKQSQIHYNGDIDSCDNDEIDVIIETTDSSDEIPAINKRRIESSIELNGDHVAPKQKCYGIDKIQRQQTDSVSKVTVESNEKAAGLDSMVTSSDANGSNNEEMYFALSLVGILKRLPPQKRAKAKCHIMNYLTELEFGP